MIERFNTIKDKLTAKRAAYKEQQMLKATAEMEEENQELDELMAESPPHAERPLETIPRQEKAQRKHKGKDNKKDKRKRGVKARAVQKVLPRPQHVPLPIEARSSKYYEEARAKGRSTRWCTTASSQPHGQRHARRASPSTRRGDRRRPHVLHNAEPQRSSRGAQLQRELQGR